MDYVKITAYPLTNVKLQMHHQHSGVRRARHMGINRYQIARALRQKHNKIFQTLKIHAPEYKQLFVLRC